MGLLEVLERAVTAHPLLFPVPQLTFLAVLICVCIAAELRRATDRRPAPTTRQRAARHRGRGGAAEHAGWDEHPDELRTLAAAQGDPGRDALWQSPPVLPHREAVLVNPAFGAHIAATCGADPQFAAYATVPAEVVR